MDALTLLLIVDMCNREHAITDHGDKPAHYQAYTSTYPKLVAPAIPDRKDECFAYQKPSWSGT